MITRWVILKTPWWECISAALPFLVQPGDRWVVMSPDFYWGPRRHERDIIMNAHRSPELGRIIERDSDRIQLYETENLLGAEGWAGVSAKTRLRCPSVKWLNYSAANAQVYGDEYRPLRRLYATARESAPRPIDVLFVGSLNARRILMLERLRRAGLKVEVPRGPCFGADLAALEARSRLLLNIHYYMPGVFESFRVVPAIHRGTPVLSERSVGGEGAEWCPTADYHNLVEAALVFLKGNP